MKRPNPFLLSAIASAVTSVMLLAAAPADAQTGGYAAKPAAKPATSRLVVRDTVWTCGEAGCASSSRASSRPAFVCESLVKQVGTLESFSAAGKAFDADALAKCNTKA